MAFDPVTAAFDLGGKVLDHFFPDPVQKAQAQAALEQMKTGADLAINAQQQAVNQAEAANLNVFIAGWRPFIGWICGLGLACQFIIGPLFTWGAALIGHPVVFPTLDTGTLTTLLIGMLGLGGMRTAEKLQNAASNH